MATALDVIKDALTEIGVLAAEESPDSEQAQSALRKLNQMVAAWELEGIAIGAPSWVLSDTIQLPENHLQALVYNLATRLAPGYGANISPITVGLADDGYRYLQGAYGQPIEMVIDRTTLTRRWPWRL